ncbi:MAG: hypothetical protein NC452_02315 [Eubacterium sp.]|nr:hypothetical protein [Eubacterium sp.]
MDEKNTAVSVEKPKRKTHTSTAVKRRYNNKVYSRIHADLPKELVVAFKEKIADNETTVAAVLREAMERYIEENENAAKHVYSDKTRLRIYADLPKEFVAKFTEAVSASGRSITAVFRNILEKYLDDSE